MVFRIVTSLALLWGVAACREAFDTPDGTRRYDPPAVYQQLWGEVEQCSRLRGDFGRARWFMVPQTPFPCPEGKCTGAWEAPHNIYIADAYVNDSAGHYFTVRHEMLHELLRGGLNHPPVFITCNLWRGR